MVEFRNLLSKKDSQIRQDKNKAETDSIKNDRIRFTDIASKKKTEINERLKSKPLSPSSGIQFKDIRGVALDGTYFYLSDFEANCVYVWDDIPDIDEPPLFSLNINGPWRLSSDGEYLAVTSIFNYNVYLYRVADLSVNAMPVSIGSQGTFNLPQNAIVSQGSLFIADTNFNQVHIWQDIEDAINGKNANVVLGEKGFLNTPMIGTKTLFWPAGLAFDGSYLWVGEFKFSGRLLRFSVQSGY